MFSFSKPAVNKFSPSQERTDELIDYVIKNSLPDLKKALDNFPLYPMDTILDKYENNLLHIATIANQPQIIRYFLNKGLSCSKLNKFGQSAWDLALLNRNQLVIDEFLTHKMTITNDSLKSQVMTLNNQISDLKTKNGMLALGKSSLKATVDSLSSSIESERSQIRTLNNTNSQLTAEKNALQKELNREKVQSKLYLSMAQEAYARLETEKNALQTELNKEKSQDKLYRADIFSNLQDECVGLRKKVHALTLEKSKLESSYKAVVLEKKSTLEQYSQKYKNLLTETEDLRQSNKRLKTDNKNLQTSIESLMATNCKK